MLRSLAQSLDPFPPFGDYIKFPTFYNLCVLIQSAYVGFPIQPRVHTVSPSETRARLPFDGINMMRPLGWLMYMGRLTRTFCITIYWLYSPPMSPPSLLSMSRYGQDVILVWPVTDHRLVKPIAFVALFDLYVSTAILEISYSLSALSRHRQDTIGYLNR